MCQLRGTEQSRVGGSHCHDGRAWVGLSWGFIHQFKYKVAWPASSRDWCQPLPKGSSSVGLKCHDHDGCVLQGHTISLLALICQFGVGQLAVQL